MSTGLGTVRVTVCLPGSSSNCPNCQCVCICPLIQTSQMAHGESSRARGRDIKYGDKESKAQKIPELVIKIERGLNFSVFERRLWWVAFQNKRGAIVGLAGVAWQS